jgi:hypothetical protein
MFGSRSGSPYGAFGLLNAPNASEGAGGPLNTSNGAPMPSGGRPDPSMFSVYNKGIDNETNTVPSTFVIPSSHPHLTENHDIREGDFLFVLRDTSGATSENGRYGETYETRYSRLGKPETAIATLQKVNQLLRKCALDEHRSGVNVADIRRLWDSVDGIEGGPPAFWWMQPDAVCNWATPFGAALNSMKLGSSSKRDIYGHNIVVSRRANIKNNFFTVKGDRAEKWHTQSMRHAAVQYSVEAILLQDGATTEVPVVQLSMLLIDDKDRTRGTPRDIDDWYRRCDARNKGVCRAARPPGNRCDVDTDANNRNATPASRALAARAATSGIETVAGCLVINAINADAPRPDERSYGLFADRPLGDPATRMIVPIGRILHSAPQCPTAADCLLSCHSKSVYDRLPPVEVELGCH